jgi:hypothetical protein
VISGGSAGGGASGIGVGSDTIWIGGAAGGGVGRLMFTGPETVAGPPAMSGAAPWSGPTPTSGPLPP